MDTHTINVYQRRVLMSLIEMEAARNAVNPRAGRERQHRLFRMLRETFGCKYSEIPRVRFREAAIMLLDEPLN